MTAYSFTPQPLDTATITILAKARQERAAQVSPPHKPSALAAMLALGGDYTAQYRDGDGVWHAGHFERPSEDAARQRMQPAIEAFSRDARARSYRVAGRVREFRVRRFSNDSATALFDETATWIVFVDPAPSYEATLGSIVVLAFRVGTAVVS